MKNSIFNSHPFLIKEYLIVSAILVFSLNLTAQEPIDTLYAFGNIFSRNKKIIFNNDHTYEILDGSICFNSTCYSMIKYQTRKNYEYGSYNIDTLNHSLSLKKDLELRRQCCDSIETKRYFNEKNSRSIKYHNIQYKDKSFWFLVHEKGYTFRDDVYGIQNDLLKIVHQLNRLNICADFYSFKSWNNERYTQERFAIKKDIKNRLPEKYKRMILDAPIASNLLNIESVEIKDEGIKRQLSGAGKIYQLTFDVGKNQGVVEGLRFYHNERSSIYATITEVYPNSCKGYFVKSVYHYFSSFDWRENKQYSTFVKDWSKVFEQE